MAREGKESALYLGQEGGRNEDEFSLSPFGEFWTHQEKSNSCSYRGNPNHRRKEPPIFD